MYLFFLNLLKFEKIYLTSDKPKVLYCFLICIAQHWPIWMSQFCEEMGNKISIRI